MWDGFFFLTGVVCWKFKKVPERGESFILWQICPHLSPPRFDSNPLQFDSSQRRPKKDKERMIMNISDALLLPPDIMTLSSPKQILLSFFMLLLRLIISSSHKWTLCFFHIWFETRRQAEIFLQPLWAAWGPACSKGQIRRRTRRDAPKNDRGELVFAFFYFWFIFLLLLQVEAFCICMDCVWFEMNAAAVSQTLTICLPPPVFIHHFSSQSRSLCLVPLPGETSPTKLQLFLTTPGLL